MKVDPTFIDFALGSRHRDAGARLGLAGTPVLQPPG
jgi:hypothetical protein